MKSILRRFFFLAFTSLGLALLLAPLNLHTQRQTVKKQVFLTDSDVPLQRTDLEKNCEGRITELNSQHLAGIPGLESTLSTLQQGATVESSLLLNEKQWRELVGLSLASKHSRVCLISGEMVFRLDVSRVLPQGEKDRTGTNLLAGRIGGLGPVQVPGSDPIRRVTREDLKGFSSVLQTLEKREKAGFAERVQFQYEPSEINPAEWEVLATADLAGTPQQARFIFGKRLYTGEEREDLVRQEETTGHLARDARITGGVSFMLGLLFLPGLYRRRDGIQIATPGAVMAGDFVTLCFAALAFFAAADAFFGKYFGTTSIVDEKSRFMGVFFLMVGLPVMSIFTSSLAGQTLFVNEHGVRSDGLISRQFIPWDQLTEIERISRYLAVQRVGLPVTKRFQVVLQLKSPGKCIVIQEPPREKTKRQIVTQLLQYAPERWKEVVREKTTEW